MLSIDALCMVSEDRMQLGALYFRILCRMTELLGFLCSQPNCSILSCLQQGLNSLNGVLSRIHIH